MIVYISRFKSPSFLSPVAKWCGSNFSAPKYIRDRFNAFLTHWPRIESIWNSSWVRYDKHREVNVKLIEDDVITLNTTLAYVIHPSLAKYKEHIGEMTIDFDIDDFTFEEDIKKRWLLVIGEMIYAFESQKVCPYMPKGSERCDEDRMANGLRLFGKYYKHIKI